MTQVDQLISEGGHESALDCTESFDPVLSW
jgi:hypothetical protein